MGTHFAVGWLFIASAVLFFGIGALLAVVAMLRIAFSRGTRTGCIPALIAFTLGAGGFAALIFFIFVPIVGTRSEGSPTIINIPMKWTQPGPRSDTFRDVKKTIRIDLNQARWKVTTAAERENVLVSFSQTLHAALIEELPRLMEGWPGAQKVTILDSAVDRRRMLFTIPVQFTNASSDHVNRVMDGLKIVTQKQMDVALAFDTYTMEGIVLTIK